MEDNNIYNATEDEILENTDGEKFIEILKQHGLNVNMFLVNKNKINRTNLEKLNKVLQYCKKEKGIEIKTCLIELDKTVPFDKSAPMLNESTMKLLKQEYHNVSTNSLNKFFK